MVGAGCHSKGRSTDFDRSPEKELIMEALTVIPIADLAENHERVRVITISWRFVAVNGLTDPGR